LRIRRAEGALGVRRSSAIDVSPLLGLRLRTDRLELRLPNDDEILELAGVAEQGVHPLDFMPFRIAWTDSIGSPGFTRGFAAFHRQQREHWTPESWWLELAVWAEGTLIGIQAISGENFGVERTAATASWLGQRFQGQGYGTEMRSAALELIFTALGARVAISGAVEGNIASRRVSEKLGYLESGHEVVEPRGVQVTEVSLRLERKRWLEREHPQVEIDGLEPCLALFGL
jgi:RimJ/RimL family protein N-acetyltransferase